MYTDTLADPAVEAVVRDWKGQLLTLGGHLEIVETSVTETTTPPDEIGVELPVDTAGRELPLVKIDAEVFPEEVVITTPFDEVGVELPVDMAGGELALFETDAEVVPEVETPTPAVEVGVELPVDVAGRELALLETDAEVLPAEVVIELTIAVAELELEVPTDENA